MIFSRKFFLIIPIFAITADYNLWSVRYDFALEPNNVPEIVHEHGMNLVSCDEYNHRDLCTSEKKELYVADNGTTLSVEASYNYATGDGYSTIKLYDPQQSEFTLDSDFEMDSTLYQGDCIVADAALANNDMPPCTNCGPQDDIGKERDFALDARRQEMQERTRTYRSDRRVITSVSKPGQEIRYQTKVERVDLVKLIQEKIFSNEMVVKQLLEEKVALEKQLSKWYLLPSTKQIMRQKITFINALQDGSLIKTIAAIQKSDTHTALQILKKELSPLWPWPHTVTYLVEHANKPDENAFIKMLGVNIMKEAESSIVLRSDFKELPYCIPQIKEFERQCYKDLVVGNINNLLLKKAQLQSELLKFNDILPWERDPRTLALHKAKLVITESLLDDPRLQIYFVISQAQFPIAQEEYNYLDAQLKDHFESQNIKSSVAQRTDMIRREGFDILTVAKTLLETRLENIGKELEPMHRMLSTIKNESLQTAQDELIDLKQQIEEQCAQQNITTDDAKHEHITQCEGFNVLEFADALFTSRQDHPNHVSHHDVLAQEKLLLEEIAQKNRNEIFISQPTIIEALSASTNHQTVTDTLATTRNIIFDNASQYGLVIRPEVLHQVQWSLNALSQAPNPEAFTFHLATIEHMLHDVQKQTAAKANIQPSLVERSPELIARFVQQYFQKLNPATQLSDSLSFVVHGARYIADVTIGKLYLTETAYKERTDQFWEFVEAVRHLNQLEAEQWVDVVSHLAADMTYSFGIGKTVRYLKEIDAIGKAKQQATSVVNQLKKGLDAVLAERPIVITAEGIAIQAPKAAEELALLQKSIQKTGGAVKETIKDAQGLLKAESEINNAGKNVASSNLKPLGRGSTGRAVPANLNEQLALKQVMSDVANGKKIKLPQGMTDMRWHKSEGWEKMTYHINGIEIHYVAQWKNGIIQAIDDFKFVEKITKAIL